MFYYYIQHSFYWFLNKFYECCKVLLNKKSSNVTKFNAYRKLGVDNFGGDYMRPEECPANCMTRFTIILYFSYIFSIVVLVFQCILLNWYF